MAWGRSSSIHLRAWYWATMEIFMAPAISEEATATGRFSRSHPQVHSRRCTLSIRRMVGGQQEPSPWAATGDSTGRPSREARTAMALYIRLLQPEPSIHYTPLP